MSNLSPQKKFTLNKKDLLNMKKLFLLITLLCYFQTNTIFSEEKKRVLLRWNKVPTASMYIIELRDSTGKVILKEQTTETSMTVEIEPGNYERRISVYNKLGETEVATDWSEFRILLSQAPILETKEPFQIQPDQGTAKIPLQGKNFDPNMKVSIMNGDVEIPAKQTTVKDGNNAIAEFDTRDLPPGKYDLVLANPKKSSSYPKQIVSKEAPAPEEEPVQTHGLKRWEIVKRSAVLPGWGEYYAGQKVPEPKYEKRGKIYFFSFAAATLLYLYWNEFTLPGQKTPTEKKYESESTKYLAGSFVLPNLSNNSRRIAALYGLNYSRELEQQVNDQAQKTNLMLGLMLGIYVTQLVDAFFIEKDLKLSSMPFFRDMQFSVSPQKVPYSGQIETYYHMGYSLGF